MRLPRVTAESFCGTEPASGAAFPSYVVGVAAAAPAPNVGLRPSTSSE